jgi:hypothetical protein
MQKIIDFFKGKKTYITAIGIAAVVFCKQMGYITEEQYQMLLVLLGGAGLAALRLSIGK